MGRRRNALRLNAGNCSLRLLASGGNKGAVKGKIRVIEKIAQPLPQAKDALPPFTQKTIRTAVVNVGIK
jgi:hypothetical protein